MLTATLVIIALLLGWIGWSAEQLLNIAGEHEARARLALRRAADDKQRSDAAAAAAEHEAREAERGPWRELPYRAS